MRVITQCQCHGEFGHPVSLVVVDELLNIPGPPPGPFAQNSTPTTRVAEDTRPIPPAIGASGENHPAGTINDSESDGREDAAAV